MHQLMLSQRMDFYDPVSVISTAACSVSTCWGLYKHLVLLEDIDMQAREFGQGLASNYKNLHYRAAIKLLLMHYLRNQ